MKDKGKFLRQGGLDSENANQIGLLPSNGWQQRNYRFLRNIVIPSMFAQRTGDSQPVLSPLPESGLDQVTWIGHATFLIQTGGLNVLVDPNWAMWHSIFKRVRRPGLALGDLPPIDLILITHAHYDHLHLKSLEKIADGQPILLPKGVSSLVRRLNLKPVEMDWWDEFEIDNLRITFTPAKHWGARYVHDLHRGFGGYMLQGPKRTVFHCGDSAAFEGFNEIGSRFDNIDLALMPIGAYDSPSGRQVHMNPEEAIDSFLALGAKDMSPMHYGSFPLGGEPMHEPLERLIYYAGSLGLSHRVQILHEGASAPISRSIS
ncbi:MAG: L-ascorbate metabolism protein UlaG (beta-lactamase superfamily) [Verrucomicrobiales bacterium]|jgi:L-ascorbate metabolism protein UlaG (beta-lactamase superfamily)